MFGIHLFDFAWLAAALLCAGAIRGLFAGVFGVGGGAMAVPVLYELFRFVGIPEEVRMPLCISTSFAIIIPTSIRSFAAHRAKGAVDMSVLRIWAVPVVLGVCMGSVIARYAPAGLFKMVFVGVAGVSAFRLLAGKSSMSGGAQMPQGVPMVVFGWGSAEASTQPEFPMPCSPEVHEQERERKITSRSRSSKRPSSREGKVWCLI